MTYNLFIDDMRNPQDVTACLGKEWVVARSMFEVGLKLGKYGPCSFISFDHDMTEAHYGMDYSDGDTGADIAFDIAEFCYGNMPPYQVHSLNPDAPKRIADAIERARHEATT